MPSVKISPDDTTTLAPYLFTAKVTNAYGGYDEKTFTLTVVQSQPPYFKTSIESTYNINVGQTFSPILVYPIDPLGGTITTKIEYN